MTTALWFTEDMVGFAAVGATDPVAGAATAKAAGSTCAFRLTIRTDDVDACVGDPTHLAGPTGNIDMPAFGGKDMRTLYVTLSGHGKLIAIDDWPTKGLRLAYNA